MKKKFIVDKDWFFVPTSASAPRCKVTIAVEENTIHDFELPVGKEAVPDWWATIDLSLYRGREIEVICESELFFKQAYLSDTKPALDSLYQEKRRPQIHFSSKRGWLNDPNGLVYFKGEYHLFYQHNPYFSEWGNMHWGHAVSTDLVHWRELEIALFPDQFGTMFSGSAVVDWNNTSGLGNEGSPPIVFLYTAAGKLCTQCVAYSLDGRKIEKYSENPVLPAIEKGNRDPKVFWDSGMRRWMMVLYVSQLPTQADTDANPPINHTVHFLSSDNLKSWKAESIVDGGSGGDNYLYECSDFFALEVVGERNSIHWVLIGANAEYQVGTFDGKTFIPSASKARSVVGEAYYAGQSFSDEPNGRRIMFVWLRVPSPEMPFSQCMSLPLELKLHRTQSGLRLAYWPVVEIESLRYSPRDFGASTKLTGQNVIAANCADAFDLELVLANEGPCHLEISLRGTAFIYDSQSGTLSLGQTIARLPVREDIPLTNFRIIGDRTTLEIFLGDGLIYWPLSSLADTCENKIAVTVISGTAIIRTAVLYEMDSIWSQKDCRAPGSRPFRT